jgi:small-conductance mechanosensitive channel
VGDAQGYAVVRRQSARTARDIGLREALGAILRYGLLTLSCLAILQAAGTDLTSLNVLVGAIGVGLGFG